MAGLKMSFMDALRVAAQTKEAPKEWGIQGEKGNSPPWPASLGDFSRSAPASRKRQRNQDDPVADVRSPAPRGHPGLTAFTSDFGSLPSSPVLNPASSAPLVQRTFSLPASALESSLPASQKGPPGSLPRVHSHQGMAGRASPALCPSNCPPAPKRRKPFDLSWINAVAGSIRGPWTGERSAAEDEVELNLLSRSRSQNGSYPCVGNGLGGFPGVSQPTDAVKAKLKENVLQQVFECRQALQKSQPSLPEIMQWRSGVLSDTQPTLTPECSETAAPLSRPTVNSARKAPGPAGLDLGMGSYLMNFTSGHSQRENSPVVPFSAIQKCLMAAPPRRSSGPFTSFTSTQASSSSASAAAMSNHGRAFPQCSAPQSRDNATSGMDGVLSSSLLSKCLAVAPPAAPPSTSAENKVSVVQKQMHSLMKQTLAASDKLLQSKGSTVSHESVGSWPTATPSVRKTTDVGTAVSTVPVTAGAKSVPPTSSPLGEKVNDNGALKAAGSSDDRTSVSWCPAPSRQDDLSIDDFLRVPSPGKANLRAVAGSSLGCDDLPEEDVLKLAAACMNSFASMAGAGGKLLASRKLPPQNTGLSSSDEKRPAPLLVDAEALVSMCPDMLADICDDMSKSPNNIGSSTFEWEGSLPTPGIGGSDDLWAEALKADLPSPCDSSARLW